MTPRLQLIAAIAMCFALSRGADAFAPVSSARVQSMHTQPQSIQLRMSETEESTSSPVANVEEEEEEVEMDPATRLALEKQKKADELRAQEVFMKRSTGIHKCSNCDWEYSPEKGDSFLIGGMIKPGTEFEELPSNWRCPTCRASKDNFIEVVETIPGFEVNQGYGFGTNSMTSGQKNSLIWGSIAAFFLLFIGGYALS
mmetsp:Transcript_6886/g.14954  ORF Transcript_6886/g.14954 Transcript_6886/m.14954 type:complete len:199 (+) Transcript_6886:152-748(+)